MKMIQGTIENKVIVKKSVFITTAIRVNNIDDVFNELSIIKKKYYNATHNSYAYILGDSGQIKKSSDDGEPQKTAGIPILDCLIKQNITNILVVVTRFFGGIMLGTGGLVRAYSNSVSEALNKSDFFELILMQKFSLIINYSDYNQILCQMNNITILDQSFNDDISITIGVPFLYKDLVKKELIDKSANRIIIIDKGTFLKEEKITS